LNDDASLWLNLSGIPLDGDAIRKYRRTACPVEGDDDVDDFDDDPDAPGDETPPPDTPDTPPDDAPGDEQPT